MPENSSNVRVMLMVTCFVLAATEEGDGRSGSSASASLISDIRVLLGQLEDNLRTEGHICSDDGMAQRKVDHGDGAVFTRWGRTSCPENGTELVYNGFIAGSWYANSGSAAQHLCLPREPVWDKYDDGDTKHGGFIHGTEFGEAYRTLHIFGENLDEQNAPCSVCQSTRHNNVIMVPGRPSCFPTWTEEYHGYLMGGHYGHDSATEFICVDANPEKVMGENAGKGGALLYFVEVRCVSLPCPPYVSGRELPCVVCTK